MIQSLCYFQQFFSYSIWMWQRAQCSVLEYYLTEILCPKQTWYSTQSIYTDTMLTHSDSYFYILNAECQAKEQLVSVLKSLVWLGRRLNTQPPGHKVDTLLTELLNLTNLMWKKFGSKWFLFRVYPFSEATWSAGKQTGSLFVLRFYGPVNPMGSCWAWSVYLTTCLLGRLSPLSS